MKIYNNENLTMPESLRCISHFFLGDLITSFHLITLRINCGQMYSNNRPIYKEQEAFLAVPGGNLALPTITLHYSSHVSVRP